MRSGGRAIACLLLPASLLAQSVHGRVTATDTDLPVQAAIVSLLDSNAVRLAATITSDSGTFAFPAVAPGRYRARVERVGFRTITSLPFELRAGEVRDLRLHAATQSVRLDAVRVTAESHCVVRPEQGAVAATLWDEVRKALTATDISQRQHVFTMRVRHFDRDLATSLRVVDSSAWETEGESTAPFVSIDPAVLARVGFVSRGAADTMVYAAPDAHTLLSPQFLDTHCFRAVDGGDDRPGLIGLAFAPIPGRYVSDVTGTLWVDAHSDELRWLEFRYANLDANVPTNRLGGRIDFQRLPDGRWIVQRWVIRAPRLRELHERVPMLSGFVATTRVELIGIKELGGEVLEVLPPGTRRGGLGAIAGVAMDSLRDTPLAGARVFISGTTRYAVTDSAGRYRIDSVPPGRYVVGIVHPRFDDLLQPAPGRDVSLDAGRTARVDLAFPSHESVVHTLCPSRASFDTLAIVLGIVRPPAQLTLTDSATVLASWSRYAIVGGRYAARDSELSIATRAGQRYVFCGLPTDRTVTLRLKRADDVDHPKPVVLHLERGEIRRVDLPR